MDTPRLSRVLDALRGEDPSPYARALARAVEELEAEVWNTLFDAPAGGAGLHAVRIGTASALAAPGVDVLALNRVVGLGLGAPASEALVDAVIDRYRAAGVPRFFVQVSPAARPRALAGWLAARGFVHHNNWVKLVRGVEAPPAVETGLRVEEVEAAHAAPFGAILAPAFDWPQDVAAALARLPGRPGWRAYLAFDGAVPVAAAGLYAGGPHAYLGPAATLTAWRGRGAQGALIARRIRDAAALGCTLLVTETAEDRPDRPSPSFRNMRRFGFDVAYLRPNYLLHVPQAA